MTPLLLVIACLVLGMAVARLAHPPMGLAQGLNWWVINIALPALVLGAVPQLDLDRQVWFLVVSQWLVLAGAVALFHILGRSSGWSRARIGGVALVAGLGNTSFVGYPLIEALRGAGALAPAVVADQMGAFVALAAGGAVIAAIYSGQTPQPREIARRVLLFPAFLALLAGLVAGAFGGWPEPLQSIFFRLGQTLTPLALFSVGLRLRFQLGAGQAWPVTAALAWKLALAPLLVWGLALGAGIGGVTLTVSVLQAAMGPMISAAILADQHHLDPPLTNAILGGGILLSLVTVPLWNGMLP